MDEKNLENKNDEAAKEVAAENQKTPTTETPAAEAKEKIKEKVEEVKAEATKKAEEAKAEIKEKVEEVKAETTEKVEKAKAEIKEKVEEVKAEATEKVEEAKAEIKEKVEEVKAEATEKVEEAKAEIKEKVEEVKAEATEKVEETKAEIKEKVEEVKAEATEKVEEAKAEIKEKVEEVKAEPTKKVEETKAEIKEKVEETKDATVETATEEEEVQTAHDDFDWDLGARNTLTYSEKEHAEYEKMYSETLTTVAENEIVTARVSAITAGDVVLDINYKSDGLLALSEFREFPDLKVGDTVEVYVEEQEDINGQLSLSRRKAKILGAWQAIKESHDEGKVITGTVISKTKGGLIVNAGGLETFLPGSQIDIKPIIDYDSYVGKTMEFKVVKINEAIKNAVVSHKALIESDLEDQRQAIIASLEKGQVLEGLVKNITDFGAFLDLGGVDGLLYITDISWGRISHPSEILELNQKINVVVLDFDDNKKRISLGLKQLQPHPWEVLSTELAEGSVVGGKIVNIEDYGAFLEIQPGVEGLIHVSEISWSNQPVNAREFFKLNQNYEAKIVTIDREERKMSLSLKQLSEDPWSTIEAKYPQGSRHKGDVKNLTPYGVFVELEEGIGGMVHISDLSWTKRFSHPSEYTKVGSEIDVVILDIDKDSRKLSLGHKQIEENPWDTFEDVFPIGSYHEATILRRDDRGAIVQLPYGLEAYAPLKHVKKEDGKFAEVEEVLYFKVIEFNRDDKRILVSHSRYLDDQFRESKAKERQEVEGKKQETRKVIKKRQASVERETLGSLAAFSQLKEQLAANEGDTKAEAPAPEKKKKKKKEEAKAETPSPEVKEEKKGSEEEE